ncbi:hypothetical protein H7I87_03210 [Mycobacterium timonense]|uniref:hypothetical protein n=1 Tax=Mycobacterium timonense TaxID=701043 RepID=UPI0021F34E63|nr:hypothetical protein [Mycobacterium timonense]MCV6993740.1 hypothetical protein [Mycobacterium timonense]
MEGADEETPTVDARYESARSAHRDRAATIDPPHVATDYFATRFQALASSMNVRMLDTDRVRKLTPLRIQRMLKEQAPDLPVSQTQIYRYFHGEAPPRLDVRPTSCPRSSCPNPNRCAAAHHTARRCCEKQPSRGRRSPEINAID